jgi:hypothetical protein
MKHLLKYVAILALSTGLFTSCTKDPAEVINSYLKPPKATAGSTRTITLPVSSDTLRGTAISYNGAIHGYLWSLISGPGVPVIERPSSATTRISSMLVAGTYKFQFAVIDSAGLTGVDTVSILVNPAVQQTLIIQPANNPFDTHVDSYNVTGGISTDMSLIIQSWTIFGTPTNWRSFVKFDQSQIPANAVIDSAMLYLYATPVPLTGTDAHSGTANGFYVERITTPNWAAALNWNSQPASTTTNRAVVPQSASAFENSIINVTNMIQDMQANGNDGFKFRLQNEVFYNTRQYASSYHTNAALRPKLIVKYH